MVHFTGLLTMSPSVCGLPPSGLEFRYTNFSGGRGFRILPTHTIRVAVTVAFDLHTLSGCRHRCSFILPTQTFRVAEGWILSTKTFRVGGVWILATQNFGVLVGRKRYVS